ncbi:LCP family protein [Aeromicrobium fastidiosum]|uniref:LytR family transcriptional regulator n=1 Tax=Aeromicrobium fastidiosum TaxID=52699 RepID=A0A641ALU7_9ACTN|nr:LCP family protein [Aeromicrobium fastidiosum]KAA1378250.1 LytR family transcriptional regulator [Aeromicrobium fastidiosum]MBP2388935.1 LCP family protein required for cell wall assembly [Aeromicrobium fastidiosum]
MSDQRPEGSYGWLYGEDDANRQAPRSNASAPPTSQLPPPNLPPPGGRGNGPAVGGGDGRPPKQKKRRTKRRVAGILVLAWIVFLVAVPIWAWGKIAKVDADPGGDRPADQPGTTYLMVGSDSRRGLTKAEQKALSTGGDGGGRGRTDTIMLLHTGSGPDVLMSIPRDSLVDIPGYGRTKINAAYAYGGAKLLVKTIENNTGIRVDDYVEVGFGGLVKVVDSLGGVEICPKTDIKDKDSGLDVKKGCQNADGATALAYSRNRHTYATQDIQRVQSQREVLGSIAGQAKSPWTVINPLRYLNVASGASGSLTIGENVGPLSLGKFAFALSGSMSGKGLNCTVPLRDFAVTWDPERAPRMFDLIAQDKTDEIGSLCTKDGLPKS